MMTEENTSNERLSDLILQALELAVKQEDVVIADMLTNALEVAMTRNAGGKDFVERRDFPEKVNDLTHKVHELKNR